MMDDITVLAVSPRWVEQTEQVSDTLLDHSNGVLQHIMDSISSAL